MVERGIAVRRMIPFNPDLENTMEKEFAVKTIKGNDIVFVVHLNLKGWEVKDVIFQGQRHPVERQKVCTGKELKALELGTDNDKKYFAVVIPKYNIVLSADTTLTFIKEADAFFQEHKEALLAEHKAAIAAEQAALESAVPGISVLRQAYEADDSYHDDFRRAMESEQRDGTRMPKLPADDIPALEAQYPRAVLYLRAEAYSDASHHLKAAAGKKAMQLLRDGGNEADAEAIMQNWLPAESIWD